MTTEMHARALDVDLLARELGNWRTSSRSGPAYQGLADAIRMLIVDGRLPVGARLPSERALADALRVSRTTVTAAYAQLRDDGYLNARQGARSTTALPRGAAPAPPVNRRLAMQPGRRHAGRARRRRVARRSPSGPTRSRRTCTTSASSCVGVAAAARGHRRKILRARTSHRTRRDHGDHRSAARDRADPGHLHPARRPGARRTAHLPRRPRGDGRPRAPAGPGRDDPRRLGTRRRRRRDPAAVAEPGLPDPRQPQPDRA